MAETMIIITLLLLLFLTKYSTEFLAIRPPFRAAERQIRHNLRGRYVTTAHLRTQYHAVKFWHEPKADALRNTKEFQTTNLYTRRNDILIRADIASRHKH